MVKLFKNSFFARFIVLLPRYVSELISQSFLAMMIRDSSMVEQSTVNRRVAGSSPARGAI